MRSGPGVDIPPKVRLRALGLTLLLAFGAQAQVADYGRLVRVIRANLGFAHMTRGVNMFTLVALRSCVSQQDIGVLERMLQDTDPLVRMASAQVLVDFGAAGQRVLRRRLDESTHPAERAVLHEAIEAAASPTYRPILDYPLTQADRHRIRGCLAK